MGINYNPGLPDGLHFLVDFSNIRSYAGTGTTIFDLNTNNSNNLTITGSPTYVSNGVQSSMTFSGTGQYARDASITNPINVQGPYTVCIVFTPNSTATTQNIFTISNAGASKAFQIGYRSDVAAGTVWKFGGTSLVTYSYPGVGVTAHLAITTDGSNNHVVYYNGSSVNTGTVVADTGAAAEYRLGEYNASELYNGKICYVSMHARALNRGEVLQCYNAVRLRFGLPGSPAEPSGGSGGASAGGVGGGGQ